GSGEDAFFALVDPPAALTAASAVTKNASTQMLSYAAVQPVLTQALARWAAAGVNPSALAGIDIHIADLAGATLGIASGNTIYLDATAAGWGWFIDPTPADDSEFTMPGNQGEMNRIDLLTVLEHELGHILGYQHTATGLMNDTLAAGIREMPTAVIDQFFAGF
ncbi:MAG TPA: hypothetical protein VKI65_01260, partial [Gemmataceae bacterium]|nr:hypothetical protein [Gemmataceae bacterium]